MHHLNGCCFLGTLSPEGQSHLLSLGTVKKYLDLRFRSWNCVHMTILRANICHLILHNYGSPEWPSRKACLLRPFLPSRAQCSAGFRCLGHFENSQQHKVPQLLSNSLFDAWSPKLHSIYYDDILPCGAGFYLIIKKAPEQDHPWLWIKFCIKCIISFFSPWHMPLEHHAYTLKKNA